MSTETIETDICVIGGGSGGLSVAAGAVQMGARVVLIERGAMGGDCLNTGCVPSKALLAAAHTAQSVRDAGRFGIEAGEPRTDWGRVHDHVHEVIAAIAPNDSVERFERLGVRVLQADASFVDGRTVAAGEARVRAKYFVVATGSAPFVPPIEGLEEVAFFTNENIFDNREPIDHLLVVGGGPIGIELAQAHRRLGARVTVLEAARLLMKDDRECAQVVIERLRREGIVFYEGGRDLRLARSGEGAIEVRCAAEAGEVCVTGSHLLIATGRRANVAGLNLEAAGVAYDGRGITVDGRLRSSNARIYAVGDVAGPYQFTHMAAYQAGIVLRNILFKLPAKVDYRAVPWVTYTDPELAHVGMREADARDRGIDARVLRLPLAENDRAQAERRSEGLIKVVATRGGRILGATIVGQHAGELLQPWVVAVARGMKIGAMASAIAPYPTRSEASKRVAGSFFSDKLFSPTTQRLVRWLLRLS
ncbi:MAG: dihydrolipoamide dehydrogenase [Zetaproteobacteria bacterium]|nr:MAG: dihydrolipoamide dehydrogenase [Zetaproteobacteria bacterium]